MKVQKFLELVKASISKESIAQLNAMNFDFGDSDQDHCFSIACCCKKLQSINHEDFVSACKIINSNQDLKTKLTELKIIKNDKMVASEKLLFYATFCKNFKAVSFLCNMNSLSFNKYFTSDRLSCLHVATQNDDLVSMSLLIQAGAYIELVGGELEESPLFYAIKNGNIDAVGFLINCGANVNFKNQYIQTPLHIAVEYGRTEIVSMLLKHKANHSVIDFFGKTPLHVATQKDDIISMNLLIQAGASANCIDEELKKSPLFYAVKKMNLETIETLLKHNPDVNFKNQHGEPLLHAAIQFCPVKIVQKLIQHGANVNCVDAIGNTPLHIASANGRTEIIDVLLKNEANINAKNSLGDTALHYAFLLGNICIGELLLESGADASLTNNNNQDAVDYAAKYGHEETAFYLQHETMHP